MKTEDMVFAHLVRGVGTGRGPDDAREPGDALIDDADITPTSDNRPTTTHAVVQEADEGVDAHARITADQSGRTDTLKTAEINVERDRRDTLTSPISALLAESMTEVAETRASREPAAPQPEGRDLTRRLGDSDRQPAGRDSSARNVVAAASDPNAQHRLRAARLIDQARALMESGALLGAVVAGEQAFEEAERAAHPGITEVIEPARPLLAKVFSTFVGPLDEVPVLGRRIETLPPHLLDDRRRAVIALVDGKRSLAQILDAARLHATDGLRVLATLMRENIIRVV